MEASAEVELPAPPGVSIDDLPDEVILEILSHLTSWELIGVTQNVSGRWRRLSRDPVLWCDKEFSIHSSCPDEVTLNWLQQMQELRTLRMSGNIKPSIIDVVCTNCSRLNTLEIDCNQQMDFALVEKLVENCPNIRSLSVPHQLLCDKRKARTFAKLRRLTSLEVKTEMPTTCKHVHLRPIADACHELAKFEVTELYSIRVQDLQYFFEARSKTLDSVKLQWLKRTGSDGRCIVPLLKVCTALTHVELSECEMFREEELSEAFAALGSLPNLHSLTMSGLANSTSPALASLAFGSVSLPVLQVLDLDSGQLSNCVVTAICRGCPRLRQLSLRMCNLTDESLTHLYLLTKLEVLDLSGCQELRGDALSHVSQVTTLRQLSLEYLNAPHLEPGLERVLDISTLETLSLMYMENANIFPFNRLHRRLVNLRVLDLRGAKLDDNNILNQLQEKMPGLKVCTVWS